MNPFKWIINTLGKALMIGAVKKLTKGIKKGEK